jgi:hypothetical protein
LEIEAPLLVSAVKTTCHIPRIGSDRTPLRQSPPLSVVLSRTHKKTANLLAG